MQKYNIIAILMGISIGVLIGYLLIFVDRFKEYMELRHHNKIILFKIIDALWRVALPLCFGLVGFLMPIEWISFITDSPASAKEMAKTYSWSFVVCCFVMCIILIKSGKIKIDSRSGI